MATALESSAQHVVESPISTNHANTTSANSINIGSRKSKLALVQTDLVIEELKKHWPDVQCNVHAISTMGDKNQVTALHNFGAKSLWTFELEDMLEKGEVDFIVHSLKDIPTQMPPSLTIGAILYREDPRDALVLHPSLPPTTTLSSLPQGSCIGTSSVRRSAQLARLHPHLTFQSVRGNVGTRLGKLDAADSPYSAIILAAAGLLRLDLGHRISRFLSSEDPDEVRRGRRGMLHAVGQGALGIQVREGDARIAELLTPLNCKKTSLACLAERSLMRTLEGGCSVPIGVETEWLDRDDVASLAAAAAKDGKVNADAGAADDEGDIEAAMDAQTKHLPWEPARLQGKSDDLALRASVTSIDGTQAAECALTKRITNKQEAEAFGMDMASALIDRGAAKILEAINLDKNVVENQGDGA